MPRKPRFFVANIPNHVIQRGINKSAVFFDDEDYQHYRNILHEAAETSGVLINAYILMTNHIHLLRVAFNDTFKEATEKANAWNANGNKPRYSTKRLSDGSYVAGPEKMFLDEAQLGGGLERSNDIFVEKNSIHRCNITCSLAVGPASFYGGDLSDSSNEYIDLYQDINSKVVDYGENLNSIEKLEPNINNAHNFNKIVDRLMLFNNVYKNLFQCIDDCQTTMQEEIFSN